MKLIVLLDNNTLTDRYFIGEPGVSYYIEEDNKKILFDVGYSDAFIKNAVKLKIDLTEVDYLVLSHGHLDHTWGLDPLARLFMETDTMYKKTKPLEIIAHAKTFFGRPRSWLGESGPLISKEKISKFFEVKEKENSFNISKKLFVLLNIPRLTDFECKTPYKKIRENNQEKDDFMDDEIALAYKSNKGLVIISACSHAGICNIIEYAKKVCNDERIVDVIGGFHLLNPSAEQLNGTLDYIKKINPKELHACHCTDLKSKIELSRVSNLKEVGVGLELDYQ